MFLDIIHRSVFIYGLGPDSKFYPKTETESSLRNVVFWKIYSVVFLDKDRTMDNVQKHNICTGVLVSKPTRGMDVCI
jgi:hypothetical protein